MFLAYDDSDGWYDHVFLAAAAGLATARATRSTASASAARAPAAGDYRGRCGPGPRLPLLVVSP